MRYKIKKWWDEGLATYLSNVAYSGNNWELGGWLGWLASVELATTHGISAQLRGETLPFFDGFGRVEAVLNRVGPC